MGQVCFGINLRRPLIRSEKVGERELLLQVGDFISTENQGWQRHPGLVWSGRVNGQTRTCRNYVSNVNFRKLKLLYKRGMLIMLNSMGGGHGLTDGMKWSCL